MSTTPSAILPYTNCRFQPTMPSNIWFMIWLGVSLVVLTAFILAGLVSFFQCHVRCKKWGLNFVFRVHGGKLRTACSVRQCLRIRLAHPTYYCYYLQVNRKVRRFLRCFMISSPTPCSVPTDVKQSQKKTSFDNRWHGRTWTHILDAEHTHCISCIMHLDIVEFSLSFVFRL